MKDTIIKYIFDENISNILKGFSENDKELISKKYMDYLKDTYEKIDDYYQKFIDNDFSSKEAEERIKKLFGKAENDKWVSLSTQMKSKILFNDSNLERLKVLSSEASSYANVKNMRTQNPNYRTDINLTEERANEIKKEMNTLLEKVQEFNKSEAQMLVSESFADLDYLLGSDAMSIRNAIYK